MDDLQRWGPYAVDGGCDAYGAMEEGENGDYVDYEDHCAEIAALRARLDAVEKERRNGAHLMEVAKSLGWPDDGEGAFNFITRRTREVAIDDCAEHAEADLNAMTELLQKSRAANVVLETALVTARRQALEDAAEIAESHKPSSSFISERYWRGVDEAAHSIAVAIHALAAQEGQG